MELKELEKKLADYESSRSSLHESLNTAMTALIRNFNKSLEEFKIDVSVSMGSNVVVIYKNTIPLSNTVSLSEMFGGEFYPFARNGDLLLGEDENDWFDADIKNVHRNDFKKITDACDRLYNNGVGLGMLDFNAIKHK